MAVVVQLPPIVAVNGFMRIAFSPCSPRGKAVLTVVVPLSLYIVGVGHHAPLSTIYLGCPTPIVSPFRTGTLFHRSLNITTNQTHVLLATEYISRTLPPVLQPTVSRPSCYTYASLSSQSQDVPFNTVAGY